MSTVSVDARPDASKRDSGHRTVVENFHRGAIVHHNFKLSHDGKKLASFGVSGVRLLVGDVEKKVKGPLFTYELIWSPTNTYFAFMTVTDKGDTLRVVDTRAEEPRAIDIYSSPNGGRLRGIEWSPFGDEIYWLETVPRDFEGELTTLKRLKVGSTKPTVVVRSATPIEYFMPPVTRFQSGQGPSREPYSIVYGTSKGLFVVDRKGGKARVLCQAPATGVNNLEWSSDGKYIVLYFTRSYRSRKLGELHGVMLAHLGEREPEKVMENLYAGTNIHTLWFSPGDRYVTWVKETGCWFREPGKRDSEAFKVPAPIETTEDGRKVTITDKPIKGAIWNADATRLAITAGNQVWVYDHATRRTEKYYETGEALSHFLGEPRWKGDRLILTIFEDTALTGREEPRGEGGSASSAGFEAVPEVLRDKRKFLAAQRKKAKLAAAAKAAKQSNNK